ncbi:MAG: AAA-like domain-containing protein [Saprospiraceae bacterium]
MAKKFNITGTCIPSRHYMADTTAKLKRVMALIEDGEYFTINRPRQYGKTTTMLSISRILNPSEEYLAFNISFEGIGSDIFLSEHSFCRAFLELLINPMIELGNEQLADFLKEESLKPDSLKALSESITALTYRTDKKLVLLIDEVDRSNNNQLFLNFLGMLRSKFLSRDLKTEQTFHSIILAGVHDIKTLKLKLRPGEAAQYNSPWNIATDFKVEMSLLPHEIVPMLEDYAQERGVTLDAPALAERLYYFTSGYPFLVSALCKIVDEDLLPEKSKKEWNVADVETAARRLIHSERSNTNFDSLIKNLENNDDLYQLVYRMVIDNETINFNVHDPLIEMGVMYGIFRNGQGLNIHNRIYAEIIANYMTSKLLTSGRGPTTEIADPYLLPGNVLNMEKILLKFQEYMREQHSKKDRDFIERNGRLVFLAFLKPIINGKGYAFKEPEISEERRLDIAVTFLQHRYAVELKVWRGEVAHEKGLMQLSDYLNRQNLQEGYLVIFDQRSVQKTWAQEWLDVDGKRIFSIWV